MQAAERLGVEEQTAQEAKDSLRLKGRFQERCKRVISG